MARSAPRAPTVLLLAALATGGSTSTLASTAPSAAALTTALELNASATGSAEVDSPSSSAGPPASRWRARCC
jgi:hypothetical protein